jgi:hypothetical protein
LDINCGNPQFTLVSDLTSDIITETAPHVECSPSLSKDNPSHLLAGSSSTLSPDHPTDVVPARNIGGRPKGATNAVKECKKTEIGSIK